MTAQIKISSDPTQFGLYSLTPPSLLDTLTALKAAWEQADLRDIFVFSDVRILGDAPIVVLDEYADDAEDATDTVIVSYAQHPELIVSPETGEARWLLPIIDDDLEHIAINIETAEPLENVQIGTSEVTPLRGVYIPRHGMLWTADKTVLRRLKSIAGRLQSAEAALATLLALDDEEA